LLRKVAMIVSRAEILIALGKAASITEADSALLDMVHPKAERAVKDYLRNDIEQASHTQYLPIGRSIGSDVSLDDYGKSGGRVVALRNRRGGRETLQLQHTPVLLDGLEVREDLGARAGQTSGSFGDSTILSLGSDYYLDVDDTGDLSRTGKLIRNGAWPTEPRSIKVAYTGGWSRSDLDTGEAMSIKEAVLMTAANAFNQWRQHQPNLVGAVGPFQSESLGSYSYSKAGNTAELHGMVIDIPYAARMRLEQFRNYGRLVA
jgi:hypothetical protein